MNPALSDTVQRRARPLITLLERLEARVPDAAGRLKLLIDAA
jgi:hypothetical protein